MGHVDILAGIVRAIDAVADICRRGERLEAVQKSRRHVQVTEVGVVEPERLLLAEGRRSRPGVDQHVVDGAVGAANEFGLSAPAAAVHPADHPPRRAGLRILQERCAGAGHTKITVEDLGVEGPGEEPAVVAKRLRDKHGDIGEFGLLDTHGAMLP